MPRGCGSGSSLGTALEDIDLASGILNGTSDAWFVKQSGVVKWASSLQMLDMVDVAGQRLKDLVDDDPGTSVAGNTAGAATGVSVLASPLVVPANPVVGDVFHGVVCGQFLNLSAVPVNLQFLVQLDSSYLWTPTTINCAAVCLAFFEVTMLFSVQSLGAAVATSVTSTLAITDPTAASGSVPSPSNGKRNGVAPTYDTTSAHSFKVAAAISGGSSATVLTTQTAYLERLRRGF